MAQYASALTGSPRQKRKPVAIPPVDAKKRQPQLSLYFPPDVEALLTPFRVRALQNIYEIAHRHLGDRIKSTVVQVEDSYDEPGHPSLVLAIWAEMDKEEWRRYDLAVSDAVFDYTESFDTNEWNDYIDTIHFEVLPLKL